METSQSREPWNKGKLIGQKPPLKLKDIWAIRIHLQLGKRIRDLAMFNWQCLTWLSTASFAVAILLPYDAQNQGYSDLHENKKPSGSTTVVGALEVRKYRAILGDRS